MSHLVKKSAQIGGLNFLAAVAAHIPCCGSQLFLGIFGLQAMGAVSTTIIYRFQFVIPIIISLCLTLVFLALGRYKSKGLFCDIQKSRAAWKKNALEFFAVNLAVGYTIVFILYLFIPPHDHHIIDTRLAGRVSRDGGAVTVVYEDDKRLWPWARRHFVAKLPAPGEKAQPAKEFYWYQALSGDFPATGNCSATVHLYARLSSLWFNAPAAIANKKPLDFYISQDEQSKPLSTDSFIASLQDMPALVLFYSRDCTPCQIEMRLLPELKKAAPDLHMAVVSLTPPGPELLQSLEDLKVQHIAAPGADGLALLRTFHDSQVALPFSLGIDKGGAVCARRTGLMGLDVLKEWRHSCLQ